MKHKEEFITEEKVINTPAGGVLIGKDKDGQTIIPNDGSLGGFLIGRLHKDGGIKAINKGTGQPLEMQSNEVVITAPAVADQTKREFEGKMMTNREILSKINSDGGGVSFADGGDIPAKIHTTDCEYKFGGKLVKDTDIANSLGMNSTLKKGKQYFSSGDTTYDVDGIYNAVKKGKLRLKTKEVPTFAMKYPVYDKQYSETVKTDFRKPNGITVRTESGEEVLIDGNHRMNNAYLKGKKTMKTYYIEDPKQIAKFTKNSKFELGGENTISKKEKQEIIDSQNKFWESNDIYKLSNDALYVLRKDNTLNPPKYKRYQNFEDFYSDIKTRERNSIERENAKKVFEYLESNGAELQHKSIYGSRYYFYKGENIRVSNHWQTSEIKDSETGLNKYRNLPSFYSDEKNGWKKMIDEIESFVNPKTFELGGENNNFQKLVEEKFSEGYGKVKHFELNSSGGSWSYINNPNVTRSQRDKMPIYTVEVANDVREKATEIKKNYEISQPKEISILQFAEKFAKDNNGKIYHKSKSGSVYVRVKDKEIRISDHNILDRDSMNPKNRYDLEIIQRYFDEKTPSNLDYWTDEFKNGGHLAKGKSLKQIAEMHNVSLAHVNQELAKGLEVEKEHFSDFKERTRVAKDHLVENPNYYSILEKAGLELGGGLYDSKPFLDYYFEQIAGFLKEQNNIDLNKDFTFFHRGENFTVEPMLLIDKDKEAPLKTANFTILDNEGEVVGEIYFKENNGNSKGKNKQFTADSEFFNWDNFKFENGGRFDGGGELKTNHKHKENLVKDAKDGNTPARDLNNYNDLLDVQADGEVGGDSGINMDGTYLSADAVSVSSFANGGETNKIEEADLSDLLEMVKSGNYADGGVTPYDANQEGDSVPVLSTGGGLGLPKVAYVKVSNAGSSLYNLVGNKYNSYIEFAESVEDAYKKLGRTVRSFVELEAFDENEVKLLSLSSYISNQKNTVKNFNPFTGNYKNLEKSLANSRPRSFQKFDWQDWLLSKVQPSIPSSQTTIQTTASTSSQPLDLSDTKVWIGDDEGLSKAIQEVAFGLGWTWSGDKNVKYTDANYLIFNSMKFIGIKRDGREGFDANTSREINPRDILLAKKPVVTTTQTPSSTSAKPFDFTDTKIDVSNRPDFKLKVQKKAFESGWEWENNGGKSFDYDDFNYMYFTKTSISKGNTLNSFINSPKREITEQDIFGSTSLSNNDNSVDVVNLEYQLGKNYYDNKRFKTGEDLLEDFAKIEDYCIKNPDAVVSVIITAEVVEKTGKINAKKERFDIGKNALKPSNFSYDEIKKIIEEKWFDNQLDFTNFFKTKNNSQTLTSNYVVPKKSSDNEVLGVTIYYKEDGLDKEIATINVESLLYYLELLQLRNNLGVKLSITDGIKELDNKFVFFTTQVILSNDIDPENITISKFRDFLSKELFPNYDFELFFKPEKKSTSNSVVPKTTEKAVYDLDEAVKVLEKASAKVSVEYNKEVYEQSLKFLYDTKATYELALKFTPESAFMYERLDIMKKLADIEKSIKKIEDMKKGGTFYMLAKILEKLQRGENWNLMEQTQDVITNQLPQSEIDVIIRSKKFKNWFGDWEKALINDEYDNVSKALTNGIPSVYHHGARRIKYTYREVSNGVLYLAENISYALWFSQNATAQSEEGNYLTECFVNIKNPIDLTAFHVKEIDFGDLIKYIDAIYPLANIYDFVGNQVALLVKSNQPTNIRMRAWQLIRSYAKFVNHIKENTPYDGFLYYENNPSDQVVNPATGQSEENVTKAVAIFKSYQVKVVDAVLFDGGLDDWRFENGGKLNN